MRQNIANPTLILKNGGFLFVRLLFVMAIAFYTTRLTLQILGDSDYGINNIVGGVISVFAIISMPITGALQRFFNVEFTKGDIEGRVVFTSSVRIIAFLAIGMTILYETVGLIVINEVLNYPLGRQWAVNVVFQFAVLTNLLYFFTLSYSSLLYAKEDMGVPATIEIVMALLKLGLLIIIPFVSIDFLVAYGVMLFLVSAVQLLFYFIYCRRKYAEATLCKETDSRLQKDILKFAGWSSINSIAGISVTYISNVLLNVFGGVLYNTAYGLSMQLTNAVMSFSTNVMKAVDPQITSTTVAGQDTYRNKMVISTIKVCILVSGFVYVLFCFYGDFLLRIWLGRVPDYVYSFCCVSLLNILFTSIVLPLRTIIMATGRIQRLFVNYGLISLVAMLLMYALLWLECPPIVVMYVICAVGVTYFFNALWIVRNLTSLHALTIIKEMIKIGSILLVIAILVRLPLIWIPQSGGGFIMTSVIAFIVLMFMAYAFVLSETERRYLLKIKNKLLHK